MASTEDWSELLPELMNLILDQLTHISDHLRFASVCSSWKSVTINYRYYRRHLLHQLPLLMLPGNDNTETRNFFSLSSGKCYGFHIPEIHRKWCCASTQGWLITVDESTGEIQLFNPVSRDRILLPSLFTFSYPQLSCKPGDPSVSDYIDKAILSSNPGRTPDYVILAIVTIDKRLAYYKSGADRWITMTTRWTWFEDVINYKGLFYAVTNTGKVLTYDFSFEPPIETLIICRRPGRRTWERYYLVESLGELLLVRRHFGWFENDDTRLRIKTVRFEVRKLMAESRQNCFRIMRSIGDRILFLGYGCSMSVAAQDFPECKGNSIYFNGDYCYRYRRFLKKPVPYHDTGVFNFENGSVESFYDSFPIWTTPAFWITPTYPYLLDYI
ncbi:hypothetical protein NE237_005823 [Protea cynaroides]|uniref:DUF295 domain-containing protein n=1 Tax=Protea cynaroides TaxID=273540 RepID=A0A9Q0KLF7_9MAGN|nr:hypothetical protein NE237_005823 [Protea cynaroides]